MPSSDNSSFFDKYIYSWTHHFPGIFHTCLIFKFFADLFYSCGQCLKSHVDFEHTRFNFVLSDEERGSLIELQSLGNDQNVAGTSGNSNNSGNSGVGVIDV